MKNIIRYIRNSQAAVAVETAIATPIVIFALLPAADLGLRVYAKNSLNKATKSGIEYINYGSRDETKIHNIVETSYGRSLRSKDVTIDAYCGCVEADSSPDDGDQQPGETPSEYGFSYSKTQTNFGKDMCSSVCPDDSKAVELVRLSTESEISGIFGKKKIYASLQTRL